MEAAKRLIRAVLERRLSRHWFLRRASGRDRDLRARLLSSFDRIERRVRCEHTYHEMIVMADYILSDAPDGPLVECGCYLGGSSAKLSLVARETGRRLYVCDSFQGLPEVKSGEGSCRCVFGDPVRFGRGQYAAQLGLVRSNIGRSGGALDVCTFVEGYFSDSLPRLDVEPAFIFSDADLISSTRDVLKYLWPRLRTGGRFYTHDANIPDLVTGILDPEYWMKEIGTFPPVMFGAGYGCGLWAGGIGFCQKRAGALPQACSDVCLS
jgi:O-methyltransferase